MAQLKSTNINGNLTITGDLILGGEKLSNYIVEEKGTAYTGYRKYSNGILEQWINKMVVTKVSNVWGNGYVSPGQTGLDYVIDFKNPPLAIMSLKSESGDGGILMQINAGNNSKTPDFYIFRGDSLTKEVQFNLNVYAKGYWK